MQSIKYVGTSNYREITAADWKSLGIEGQSGVVWDRDSTNVLHKRGAKQVHDLEDAAVEWLLANLSNEFEVVETSSEPISEVPTIEPAPPVAKRK